MVLWIALITIAAYFPLRKLFDPQIAVLAVLVMAWDPFFIALSRLLHLDGLLASLTVFALLAFLAWLHGGQQLRYFVISGLAAGLALLTKTPALVWLPTAGLLLLLEWFRRLRAGEGKSLGLLLAFIAWMALVAVTFVGLWPAMWVAPLDVLSSIVAEMQNYAAGHELPNFFLGQATEDPGPLFYPVAFLFRTTPAVLVGLVAAVALGWRHQWPFDTPVRRRSTLGLAIFALLFAAVMMLSAKKFDRYISPVFLALDIVAVLGWLGLAQVVLEWWHAAAVPAHRLPAPPPRLGPGPVERLDCVGCDLPSSRLVCLCPLPLLFHLLQPAGRREPRCCRTCYLSGGARVWTRRPPGSSSSQRPPMPALFPGTAKAR